MRLGNTQTDCVCKPLAERTGSNFDTVSVTGFGVTRCQGFELAEVLQVVKGKLEAEEMQKNVLQSAAAKGVGHQDMTLLHIHLRMTREGGIAESLAVLFGG